MKKKKFFVRFIMLSLVLTISACGTSSDQNKDEENTIEDKVVSEEEMSDKESVGTEEEEKEEKEENDSSDSEDEVSEGSNESTETSEASTSPEEYNILSGYSAKEIEYARVWLEVIDNPYIEELSVSYISAGEPLNHYEADQSAVYPEDLIVLLGTPSASRGVFYSGNGNGTINLYGIPNRWPRPEDLDESMEQYTQDIVDNTVTVSIDVGNDEEVREIIEKIIMEP